MVVAVEVPVKLTVAPGPPGPPIVPERLKVADAEVKLTLIAWALLIVIAWLAGVNVLPELLGVTVYEPLERLLKLKLPLASAVVEAVAAPVRFTVAPDPPGPLMVPTML